MAKEISEPTRQGYSGEELKQLKDYEYYRTDLGVLYCGDCLEILRLCNNVTIDLILTDPPYGINIAKNGKVGGGKLAQVSDYGKQEWDNKIPSAEVFFEMNRVSKNRIIFGGNYFVEYLRNSSCWIVWDKDNTGNFADCELAWTSFDTAVRKYKFRWNGMLQENMKNKQKREHPTEKPIMLFYRILKDYSKDTDLILDPFLGSGTTAVACEKLGHRWIGIEISEKYCKIAKQRIEKEARQVKMF